MDIQLGARSIKLEIAKKRPGFNDALVRLSNLDPALGGKLVVEFSSEASKWTHLRELSEKMQSREEESKRLEEEQRKEAEQLGGQLRSVLASPELSAQYQYLVKQTQILTPNEFLEAHSQEIALCTKLPEAPSIDLAPLRVVAAARGQAGKVGPEDRAAIFKELPALGQLFSATVPSMMTEAQFWERCLRSRYFLNAAGHEVPASHPEDRLFDSLQSRQTEAQPELPACVSHPEADLTGEFERDKVMDRRTAANASLISRLNQRSAELVATLERSDADLRQTVEKRRAELKHAAQAFQEELGTGKAAQGPRIARLQLTSEAGSLPVPSMPQKRKRDTKLPDLKSWVCGQCAISESGTRWVLKSATEELLAAERLSADPGVESHESTAPDGVKKAITLLRHFWSSHCSETGLRARLAQEAAKLVSVLEEISSAASREDKLSCQRAAMARSLIPPVRRIMSLQSCVPQAADKKVGSRMQ